LAIHDGAEAARRDLDAIGNIYRDQLGLALDVDAERHLRVQLPDAVTVDVMEAEGEGLVEVRLRVHDLQSSRNWFEAHGIHTDDRSAGEFGVAPGEALGADLVFVA
jgi:hypothetical protein